jgi:hypothetical protein
MSEKELAPAHPAYRVFVSYIDKSRDYYAAEGYDRPYRWVHNEEAPFTPTTKPLSESRLALVTTALDDSVPDDLDSNMLPLGPTYAAPLDPVPERLHTMSLSWDKEATHTDDLDSFFPIHRLQELVAAGRVGSISPRFYGVPTEYGQRVSRDVDAPKLLEYMRQDDVDVALLVPL